MNFKASSCPNDVLVMNLIFCYLPEVTLSASVRLAKACLCFELVFS